MNEKNIGGLFGTVTGSSSGKITINGKCEFIVNGKKIDIKEEMSKEKYKNHEITINGEKIETKIENKIVNKEEEKQNDEYNFVKHCLRDNKDNIKTVKCLQNVLDMINLIECFNKGINDFKKIINDDLNDFKIELENRIISNKISTTGPKIYNHNLELYENKNLYISYRFVGMKDISAIHIEDKDYVKDFYIEILELKGGN